MIKWNLWTGVPRVKLWEAVALVLEIPPRSLEPTPHGWMNAGPGREAAPSFLPRSFPSNEKRRAFDEALEFAERGASFDGPIHILSTPFMGMSKRKAEVSLPEVVAFFVSCDWPDIPATLLALMSTGADVPPTAGANNLPTGGASSVRKDVPRPAASDAEMVAIRRCAQLVASLLKPHERQNAVRRLLGQARAGRGVLAFRLEHLGVLYYPSNPASASALVVRAKAARAAGHLPTLGPQASAHATTDELIAWAEGPEPAPDSPLLFWLPPRPAAIEALQVSTGAVRQQVHSTKTARRDPLDAAIELAQSRCRNPKDTAEVWGHLQTLALEEHPPLLMVTPRGLKYTKYGDEAAHFTRDALDKRLHPEKRGKRR